MKLKAKAFHLGDILSITHGRLVSPTHMDGVYSILNHLTQDNLYTHQLSRACEEVKPHLMASMIKNVPGFEKINSGGVNSENWREWLDEQVEKCGEIFLLFPLPENIHERKNPITELIEMVGKDKVLVIDAK